MIYFTSSVLLGELTRFKSISRQTGGRTRGGLRNSLSLSVGLLMAVFFMVSLYQDACDFFFWFSWDSCQCYRISRVCNILLGDMSDFRFARESQDSLISLGMLAISRDVSIIYIRGIWNLILQISSMSKNELMKLLMEFSQDSLEFINFFFWRFCAIGIWNHSFITSFMRSCLLLE